MSYKARSISEIKEAIITDIKNRPSLYDLNDSTKLNNPSNFSVWQGLIFVWAVAIHIFESLMSFAFTDLEIRKSQLHPNTLKNIANETLFFQYGDSLVVNSDETVYTVKNEFDEDVRVSKLHIDYAVYDETKRIVKYCSVSEESGIVLVKCAKNDINNEPTELTALEKSGVEAYWNEKKDAGQSLQILSQPADEIHYSAFIKVDGQKISNTGESQTTPGTYPVVNAIKTYFKELDFAGELTLLKLEDAIQNIDGVLNVKSNVLKAKPSGETLYIDILQTSLNSYFSIAGYCKEDSLNPLSSNITYLIG